MKTKSKGSMDLSKEQKKMVAKRRFREQLYKGPKQRLKDLKQEKAVHSFNKVLRKEHKDLAAWQHKLQKIYAEEEDDNEPSTTASTTAADRVEKSSSKPRVKKVSSVHKAEQKWVEKKQEMDQKKAEEEVMWTERKAALERYGTKKKQTHKKISKRNYKGQPIMASQIDLLLGKLQKKSKKS